MIISSSENEEDYKSALARLELIFLAKKYSPEGDELEALAILIEKYEDEHFPILSTKLKKIVGAVKLPANFNDKEELAKALYNKHWKTSPPNEVL